MKHLLLILTLALSVPATAALPTPPDTTAQQQPTTLPSAADFGNLKFKTETPDCQDAVGRERRRVIGNAVFVAAIVAVVTALVWGAINQANAQKQ